MVLVLVLESKVYPWTAESMHEGFSVRATMQEVIHLTLNGVTFI